MGVELGGLGEAQGGGREEDSFHRWTQINAILKMAAFIELAEQAKPALPNLRELMYGKDENLANQFA